jgi:polyhydroxybutyrate depolymerase
MKPWLLGGLALLMASAARADTLQHRTWNIDGQTREALVHLPARVAGAPLILAFHGHGGTMGYAARRFHMHTLWPDAIVVYPQGLPTSTPRDRNGRMAGWQMFGGGRLPNRDLTFIDALLATAKTEWHVDPKRIYATGHSNGGGFTFALWGRRPDTFAALAPVAAAGQNLIAGARPCPLLQIGSPTDTLVSWKSQQAAFATAQRVNGAAAASEFVTVRGGHAYPDEAPERIIAFFQKNRRL